MFHFVPAIRRYIHLHLFAPHIMLIPGEDPMDSGRLRSSRFLTHTPIGQGEIDSVACLRHPVRHDRSQLPDEVGM
jgi:hypothetical protein